MSVDELIDKIKVMPRDAEVSIAIDDLTDRCSLEQVVCITCDGISEVLLCEIRMVRP